jgi:hypothetical protein
MTSELLYTTGATYTVWKLTHRSRTLTSELTGRSGVLWSRAVPYSPRPCRLRPIHNRILLALGIGWALDSFEVQIIGSVLTPLANDFGVLGADGVAVRKRPAWRQASQRQAGRGGTSRSAQVKSGSATSR